MTTRGVVLGLVVVLAVASAAAAAFTGREVIAKAKDARECGKDTKSAYRMVLTSKRGDAVKRTLVTYWKKYGDDSKSIVFFREPEDVAGTGLLVWSAKGRDDDQWLYLPDLGRVRQINASARGDSFMGTDFSYADLGDTDVDERTHQLLGEEEMEGQPTYKVESVPKDATTYSKVITWVSRETFLSVRVDYYDMGGALLKTGYFRDVRKVKGIPQAFAIEMENVQTGHRTQLSLLEIDCDSGLDDDLFTERQLKRGP
jgi:outer membrane lipoprotein-sorting protein